MVALCSDDSRLRELSITTTMENTMKKNAYVIQTYNKDDNAWEDSYAYATRTLYPIDQSGSKMSREEYDLGYLQSQEHMYKLTMKHLNNGLNMNQINKRIRVKFKYTSTFDYIEAGYSYNYSATHIPKD